LRATNVLVTSPFDHHLDHQAAYSLAVKATYSTAIELATYSVWSKPLGRARSLLRDAAAKRWAMSAHRSQIGSYIADDADGFTFAPPLLRAMLAAPEQFALVPAKARRPAAAARSREIRAIMVKRLPRDQVARSRHLNTSDLPFASPLAENAS